MHLRITQLKFIFYSISKLFLKIVLGLANAVKVYHIFYSGSMTSLEMLEFRLLTSYYGNLGSP